jgi:hypothetical protein
MHKVAHIFSFILLVCALLITVGLGYLGVIPGLSMLLKSNEPKDLKISYNQDDISSAHNKIKMEYGTLDGNIELKSSIQRSGIREIKTSLNSSEMTALMNTCPWKYWPYEKVQVKLNDNSVQISGRLLKARLSNYTEFMGIPQGLSDSTVKLLAVDPVFYLQARVEVRENKIVVLEPIVLEIGKVTIHINNTSTDDKNKNINNTTKTLIANYINSRLSSIQGFYAKSAKIEGDALIFDGTIPEKVLYAVDSAEPIDEQTNINLRGL